MSDDVRLLVHPQSGGNVPGSPLGSSGGQRQHRERSHRLPQQLPQAEVGGAEAVPPLADAVRLIHAYQPDPASPAQRPKEGPTGQPLRRNKEHVQLAVGQRLKGALGLCSLLPRVQHPALEAERQAQQLVLHQRHQRRHHQHREAQALAERLERRQLGGEPLELQLCAPAQAAAQGQGRQLVEQGLAMPRGQDGQGGLAAQHPPHDL